MDFSVPPVSRNPAARPRSAFVLACASRRHFEEKLRTAGAHPLPLTTGLMAPEAYTLDALVRAWSGATVRDAAASAYHAYQHCGLTAAKRLFAAGD